MRPNILYLSGNLGGYGSSIKGRTPAFPCGEKDKRATMDADTALSIMESLDQAEALLSRMRLCDGYASSDVLAHNRELLDAARHRLEQVHSIEGMGGFGLSPALA